MNLWGIYHHDCQYDGDGNHKTVRRDHKVGVYLVWNEEVQIWQFFLFLFLFFFSNLNFVFVFGFVFDLFSKIKKMKHFHSCFENLHYRSYPVLKHPQFVNNLIQINYPQWHAVLTQLWGLFCHQNSTLPESLFH